MPKVETKDHKLLVKLSAEDVAKRKDQLIVVLGEETALEKEQKNQSRDMRAAVKALKERRKTLLSAIADGEETITVQVFERKNERLMQMETVRADTNEVVDTRPLAGDERQLDLPKGADNKPGLHS